VVRKWKDKNLQMKAERLAAFCMKKQLQEYILPIPWNNYLL
jgi:hypothetical protein